MSLAEDFYYPGSRTPRQTVTSLPAEESEPSTYEEAVEALGTPYVFTVAGRDMEFFMIGQLSAALGRSPQTLRRWESQGTIPKSGYIKPSDDPRGKRRLYSRQQAEGIIRIAIEEDVLVSERIKGTQFTAKVVALFKELKGKK